MNQVSKNQEIIYTQDNKVKCSGNGDVGGHPEIYLQFKNIKLPSELICPYCSRTFIKETAN
jgi:uncharacterized Zn-finger protein